MAADALASDVLPIEGYTEPYATLLAALANSSRMWRRELGEPDPDTIVWQPYPNGHSIGAVLLHVADSESWWIEKVCRGGDMDPELARQLMSGKIDSFSGIWPTAPREPISYYHELLDRVRERTFDAVKAFGNPDVARETEWGSVTLRWVLAHLARHDSYHGGQAVLLSIFASEGAEVSNSSRR